jgi:hypothetical protein
MKATIYDIKASKSGKHDILTLQATIAKKTDFGTVPAIRFYNVLLETGSCPLAIGAEVDVDLADYDVEVSQLDAGVSYWLKPRE